MIDPVSLFKTEAERKAFTQGYRAASGNGNFSRFAVNEIIFSDMKAGVWRAINNTPKGETKEARMSAIAHYLVKLMGLEFTGEVPDKRDADRKGDRLIYLGHSQQYVMVM